MYCVLRASHVFKDHTFVRLRVEPIESSIRDTFAKMRKQKFQRTLRSSKVDRNRSLLWYVLLNILHFMTK